MKTSFTIDRGNKKDGRRGKNEVRARVEGTRGGALVELGGKRKTTATDRPPKVNSQLLCECSHSLSVSLSFHALPFTLSGFFSCQRFSLGALALSLFVEMLPICLAAARAIISQVPLLLLGTSK
jgi:hypothetical protein